MKQLKKWACTLLMLLVLSCGSTAVLSCAITPITAEAFTMVPLTKINKKKLTLDKGKTYQLKIKGTKKKVTWKSNKPSVAKVNNKGLVTAKSAGTAKITAKVNGKKYTCTVTVKVKKPSKPTTPQAPSQTEPSQPETDPPQTEPETPEKSGKTILKEYITKYGGTNSSGNKFISNKTTENGETNNCGIVYDRSSDSFSFILTTTDYDGDRTGTDMTVLNTNSGYSTVEYTYAVSDGYGSFSARATINQRTYNKNTNVQFEITDSSVGFSASIVDSAISLANIDLQISMLRWNLLLMNKVGITMQDIGFLSFG